MPAAACQFGFDGSSPQPRRTPRTAPSPITNWIMPLVWKLLKCQKLRPLGAVTGSVRSGNPQRRTWIAPPIHDIRRTPVVELVKDSPNRKVLLVPSAADTEARLRLLRFM